MPVDLDVECPDENDLILSPRFLSESSARVTIRGRGNTLVFEDPLLPTSANIVLTGGATVRVGRYSNLNGLHVYALAQGVRIEFGIYASFNGTSQVMAHETSAIRIGDHCLFGDGCMIASSDVHKIVDSQTGTRLNQPGDIHIESHVWVAPRVAILRNAWIGSDSVIGFGSVVTGIVPSGVLAVGAPARIVRRGISWEF